MTDSIDRGRIAIYLALAFGISWLTGVIIALRGGLADSPEVIPGTGISEAFLLIALVYMFSPALAHLITRIATQEGWEQLYLRPRLRSGWPQWLMAWLGVPLLVVLGGFLYYLVFPAHFDRGLTQVSDMMRAFENQAGEPAPFTPGVFTAIQLIQAVAIAPIINALPILGEEFGWRAYLQPKLMPLGHRKAMALMGLIWGIWHWPLISMGHSYGLGYPGAPWTGWLVFLLFTFAAGTVFGWLSLRGGSVWPAVIGHGALNGVANAVIFFTIGDPNPLVGPSVAGLIGMIPFMLVGLWLLFNEDWSQVGA